MLKHLICVAVITVVVIGGVWAGDDARVVAECRRLVEASQPGDVAASELVQSYQGPIEPILSALSKSDSAKPTADRGVLASQVFQHQDLKEKYADDLLHYFVPESYDPAKAVGLIVFMHGGSRTSPREHPLHVVNHPDADPASIGLQPYLADSPFILVAPSAPWNENTGARWNVPEADEYIRAVIEESCHRFNIDRDRVILGGYSMGGFGAFHLGPRLNDRLAGVFVFSGAWKTMHWKSWTGLPLFMRHGQRDAHPQDENGKGGRPRFTDVWYSQIANRKLTELGFDPVYIEDNGDHRIQPATDTMQKLVSWMQTLRRVRYPKHVVAITPRGWKASTDTPTPHSHWITIHETGNKPIDFDRIQLNGPSPSFGESEEDFAAQSLELVSEPVNAGLVDAKIVGENKIVVETENVKSFSLWLHPSMVDFAKPLLLSVNGVESQHPIKASLASALESYQRLRDRSQVCHAKLTVLVGDGSAQQASGDPQRNAANEVRFRRLILNDQYYCDGVSSGDINGDGMVDLVAGPFWYEGPKFEVSRAFYEPVALPPAESPSNSMFSFVADFSGDGRQDILVLGRVHKHEAFWYENPGPTETLWKKHFAFHRVKGESPTLVDLDGDGVPQVICHWNGSWGSIQPDPADPSKPWRFIPIGEPEDWPQFYHGEGVGDLDSDGDLDLIINDGWYQQPNSDNEDKPAGLWTFHRGRFSNDRGGAQMFAQDVDGDGDQDVISAINAHEWGLAWYEQVQQPSQIAFREHLIMGDRSQIDRYGAAFSQPHALTLADINGDGLKDIVTGKRRWAHGPDGDVEPGAPPVVYWFELNRNPDGNVRYVPHLIDDESGVGVQVLATDLNQDGRIDVATASKLGTFVFLQTDAAGPSD